MVYTHNSMSSWCVGTKSSPFKSKKDERYAAPMLPGMTLYCTCFWSDFSFPLQLYEPFWTRRGQVSLISWTLSTSSSLDLDLGWNQTLPAACALNHIQRLVHSMLISCRWTLLVWDQGQTRRASHMSSLFVQQGRRRSCHPTFCPFRTSTSCTSIL